MSKLLNLSCALALIALTAGCAKTEAPAAATSAAATTSTTATSAPADTGANTAANITGIEACDQFLSAYEQCVTEKMPEQVRGQMQTGLDQWKKSWRDMATNDATKSALPQMCQQARESSTAALQAYGCTL